ncbi:MAG: hypothetical protein ACKODX_20570, partial [Gemmata sp.]
MLHKLFPAAALGGLVLVAIACATAQEPIPLYAPGGAPAAPVANPEAEGLPEGTEVLAKGPVHEAFATSAQAPAAEPVIEQQPPEPIEELPPDQKPEGENVQWIPGYWDWLEDDSRYVWVSGFWREPPPGHIWVPGSWRQVRGGWQWVAGFWQVASREEPQQPEIVYLPEPPQSLEAGPSVPAPTATSFYVPGSYVWRGRYVWRPGVWIEYRPNWVWVPAHFCRTPVGWVFVEGHWDYPLAQRGVLFAPVVFTRAVYTRRTFVYTPVYVVSEPALVGALFVRAGRTNYYFGDYFEKRHVTAGYRPFAGRVTEVTFTIGFGTGRNWGYDPLWSYYAASHRNNKEWNARITDVYAGRYTGTVTRPPTTLVQQNTVINNVTNVNVTNVTNNITVVNKTVTVNKQNVTDIAMLAPVKVAKDLQPEAQIKPVAAEVRRTESENAKQIRSFAAHRAQAEATVAAKQQPNVKLAEPQAIKIEAPKAAVTRAVPIKDEKKAPPAPAVKPERITPAVTHKAEPRVEPKVDPKPKVEPLPNPKVDPKPKVEPLP